MSLPGHLLKRIVKKGLATAVAIIIFSNFTQPPQKMASQEYEVKAVFLYNFAQFVEWPAETFPQEKSPLVIGILGPDPFGTYLDETIRNEEVNGHPLEVRHFSTSSQVKNCHILFIHPKLVLKFKSVLKDLKGKRILTVSDANNFARLGGMIKFFTDNKKIKLRINLEAVKAENIAISSKLLRLAEIVN